MDPDYYRQAYARRQANWDIGHAQPAIVELLLHGHIKGSVLDLGCGTGENVLQMSCLGYDAWGIDIAPEAVVQARQKAEERGLNAHFVLGDALGAYALGRRFDTLIDSGFFDSLGDGERAQYARQAWLLLNPGGTLHVLCASDSGTPESPKGARRISQQELSHTFRTHFEVRSVRPTIFQTVGQETATGHRAYIATLVRRHAERPFDGRP